MACASFIGHDRPMPRMRSGHNTIVAAALAALTLVAGCASGSNAPGQRRVFLPTSDQARGFFPVHPHQIVDFGVPDFSNMTAQSVRITGVSIPDAPPGMTIVNTRSYRYSDTGTGIIIQRGDLPSACSYYKPHPVAGIVIPPHDQNPASYAIIAARFARPGRYFVHDVRVDYVSGGKPGYQLQPINMTITVRTTSHDGYGACS